MVVEMNQIDPMIPILVIGGLVIILSIICLVRNNMVLNFRLKLNNLIYKINIEDIKQGIYDVDWRREEFQSISYNEMVYKFWRPLKSFYINKKFFQEIKQRHLI